MEQLEGSAVGATLGGRPSARGRAAAGAPEQPSRRAVTLRPLGCNIFEVHRDGVVLGSAYFERYRTRSGIEVQAWVDRPGEETIYLNSSYYPDFARAVRGIFA